MGALCCCCCDEEEYFHHRQRQTRTVPGGNGAGFGFRTQQQATTSHVEPSGVNRTNQCRICGKIIDPSLIDGHEESCRAQARRRMREEQQNQQNHQQHHPRSNQSNESETAPLHGGAAAAAAASSTPSRGYNSTGATSSSVPTSNTKDVQEDDPEHQCVICLDNKKVVAILPCAHLCCCFECSKMVDSCPLCRGPKESLLVINDNAGKCRVCHLFIAPVYLDSHQEVCRLRMRELRRKLREEQEKSDADFIRAHSSSRTDFTPNNTNSNQNQHEEEVAATDLCLNCFTKKREKFCLPCGHPFCDECSEKATHCPVCLKKVAARITVYD